MYEVCVKAEFSSAHMLRGHKGPCKDVHGHNWKIEANYASETTDDLGMVIDFADLRNGLDEIVMQLDHKTINDVPPFTEINPTAENIAKWIFDSLKKSFPSPPSKVTVYETDISSASYFE